MNEFKSSIFESIISKGIRNGMLIFILYLTSSIFNYAELIPFQIGFWGIVIIYVFLFILQIFYTNNDLKIEDKEIIIQSSLIKGMRKKKFQKDEIREILFKDEWSEPFMNKKYDSMVRYIFLNFFLMWFIPWEYKWIQIETNKNQRFRYYFFGMNYDFYDNSEEVLFEDMFMELAKRNIKVRWKSTKDIHFEGIQERANEILLNLNK
ncbi:MAG: hypothetical protein R2828_32745 [Saprospiraceae bacterium]